MATTKTPSTAKTRSRTTTRRRTPASRRTTSGALQPRRRASRPGLPTTLGTALGTLVVTTLLDLSWPVRIGLIVLVLVVGLAYVVWKNRAEIAAGAGDAASGEAGAASAAAPFASEPTAPEVDGADPGDPSSPSTEPPAPSSGR
ncbi:MAG TPA: hypothetical protein VFN43_06940 [Humibacillus sp.]|nr:hypothetical protein [Humibacillus sp.]